jgi:Fe-S-cluster containining protein
MDGAAARETVEFRLNLQQGESRVAVTAAVPKNVVRAVDLLPVLYAIDDAAVGLAEAESRRNGKEVSCRVGCAACCRQLIPVSEHEARRIAELVAALPEDRRREVEQRFERVVGELERQGLMERLLKADQLESEADRGELGHVYFALQLACPFLVNERCTIYADRPMACREYLVTSPAEKCWSLKCEGVETVPVSANVSAAAYRLGCDGSRVSARWIPLVGSLSWASQAATRPPTLAGPDLFRRFMQIL